MGCYPIYSQHLYCKYCTSSIIIHHQQQHTIRVLFDFIIWYCTVLFQEETEELLQFFFFFELSTWSKILLFLLFPIDLKLEWQIKQKFIQFFFIKYGSETSPFEGYPLIAAFHIQFFVLHCTINYVWIFLQYDNMKQMYKHTKDWKLIENYLVRCLFDWQTDVMNEVCYNDTTMIHRIDIDELTNWVINYLVRCRFRLSR